VNPTEPGNARQHELERRIAELETRDEAAFGRFTAVDWTLCIVFAVALPLLFIWWWAP
jgi:hypothetical protein